MNKADNKEEKIRRKWSEWQFKDGVSLKRKKQLQEDLKELTEMVSDIGDTQCSIRENGGVHNDRISTKLGATCYGADEICKECGVMVKKNDYGDVKPIEHKQELINELLIAKKEIDELNYLVNKLKQSKALSSTGSLNLEKIQARKTRNEQELQEALDRHSKASSVASAVEIEILQKESKYLAKLEKKERKLEELKGQIIRTKLKEILEFQKDIFSLNAPSAINRKEKIKLKLIKKSNLTSYELDILCQKQDELIQLEDQLQNIIEEQGNSFSEVYSNNFAQQQIQVKKIEREKLLRLELELEQIKEKLQDYGIEQQKLNNLCQLQKEISEFKQQLKFKEEQQPLQIQPTCGT
ncbi:17612_t:CDS:2 [Funneliformis geosporum]|nr:17612_t:CDS:2 [Funneliformis geosporum]